MKKIKCNNCFNDWEENEMTAIAGDPHTIYICSICRGVKDICASCCGLFPLSAMVPIWDPEDQHSEEVFFMRRDSETPGHVCKECISREGFERCEECGAFIIRNHHDSYAGGKLCLDCHLEKKGRDIRDHDS